MNALTPMQVSGAPLPQVYESAKAALAQCETVDECKEWADKAEALASYAKQAADDDLENMARRIRSRAIRNIGKLLEQIEPQKGGRPSETKDASGPSLSERAQVARDAGISERQQKTAMRVAAVPQDEFEYLTESDKPATVTQLAERGTRKRVVVDHTSGRDPDIFNRCMHFVSGLTRAAKDLTENSTKRLPDVRNLDLLQHMTPEELAEAQEAAETLREICEEVEAFK